MFGDVRFDLCFWGEDSDSARFCSSEFLFADEGGDEDVFVSLEDDAAGSVTEGTGSDSGVGAAEDGKGGTL